MYFNDGSYLWLTENMFVYFVSEVDVTVLKPKEIKIKSAGSSIHIWKQEYTINEISKLLQMEVQGEIPYEAFNDETYFKYELTAVDNSAWATICIYDKDTIEATKFRKIELSDLQLKDVTEFKEWM